MIHMQLWAFSQDLQDHGGNQILQILRANYQISQQEKQQTNKI